MGYDDDCILKIDQEFFQPGDGVQIQMVGRLIQKQNVRVAEQCLGKKNLDLFRAIQVLHNLIVIFRGNAKAVQKSSGIGFCLPSVHGGEFRLQLAGFYAIFIGEIFFGIDGFLFLHNLIKSGVSHHYSVQDGIFVILEVILLEERQTLPRSDDDIALSWLQLSGENL